jgi:hypothetical protein
VSPGPRPDGRAIVTAAVRGLGDRIVEVGAGGEVTGSVAEGVLGEAWGCPDRLDVRSRPLVTCGQTAAPARHLAAPSVILTTCGFGGTLASGNGTSL